MTTLRSNAFCAGKQSRDCSLHVADAMALIKLIPALKCQTDLETLTIDMEAAFPPDLGDPYSSNYDEEDDDDFVDPMSREFHLVSAVTAKLFHQTWHLLGELLEDTRMVNLK